MIYYSFIIPHKNTPSLLARCVNSIPQRDDIEIIVIDDNSDVDKKPRLTRPDVRIIYIDSEQSKGAGRARNYGLKEAIGKWLLFPDADDYYVDNFLDILDKHKEEDSDVLYFNASESPEYEIRLRKYKNTLMSYDGTRSRMERLKFLGLNAPWVKMVRKSMIDKYNIRFEEIMHGNDMFFTYQIGYFAKSINVELNPVYFYYCNPNSLTNEKNSVSKDIISLQHFFQTNEFRKFIGHGEWVASLRKRFMRMIKRSGLMHAIRVYGEYRRNRGQILSRKNYFVDTILLQERNGRYE